MVSLSLSLARVRVRSLSTFVYTKCVSVSLGEPVETDVNPQQMNRTEVSGRFWMFVHPSIQDLSRLQGGAVTRTIAETASIIL